MQTHHSNAIAQLPERAFIDNSARRVAGDCDAPLIEVRRGQLGYWPIYRADLSADAMNAAEGVDPAQREAMLAGSLFGWDCALANPAAHQVDGSVDYRAMLPQA